MTRLFIAIVAVLVGCGGPQAERGTERRPASSSPASEGREPSPVEAPAAPEPTVATVADGATPVTESPTHSEPEPATPEPSPAQRALDAATLVRLPAPPMRRTVARRPTPVRRARLRRASSRRNGITDVDAWYRTNQLRDPVLRARGRPATLDPADHPTVPGHGLVRAVAQPDAIIYIYSGSVLAVLDDRVRAFFDLTAFAVLGMDLTFAWVVGDVLYVSHSHRGYASTTNGQNAYLSAIDMPSQTLIWRSAPLEANARTFAVVGDVIVTGYGFTDEKDYLYALDRHTGRRLDRARLETGPRFILERGGRVYVRAYDRDYEYELVVRTR